MPIQGLVLLPHMRHEGRQPRLHKTRQTQSSTRNRQSFKSPFLLKMTIRLTSQNCTIPPFAQRSHHRAQARHRLHSGRKRDPLSRCLRGLLAKRKPRLQKPRPRRLIRPIWTETFLSNLQVDVNHYNRRTTSPRSLLTPQFLQRARLVRQKPPS